MLINHPDAYTSHRRQRLHRHAPSATTFELGHEVVCAVRNRARFSSAEEIREQVELVEIDFLETLILPKPSKILMLRTT